MQDLAKSVEGISKKLDPDKLQRMLELLRMLVDNNVYCPQIIGKIL